MDPSDKLLSQIPTIKKRGLRYILVCTEEPVLIISPKTKPVLLNRNGSADRSSNPMNQNLSWSGFLSKSVTRFCARSSNCNPPRFEFFMKIIFWIYFLFLYYLKLDYLIIINKLKTIKHSKVREKNKKQTNKQPYICKTLYNISIVDRSLCSHKESKSSATIEA